MQLNYDGGKTKYSTISGLLLTFLLVVTTLAYVIRQQLVMVDRKDIVVNSHLEIGGALPISMDGYGKKQGLTFAFAVAKWGYTEQGLEEQLDYGSVNAYYEIWNKDSDYRPCTLDDFGLGENPNAASAFFKADEFQFHTFNHHLNVLQCTDEPLELKGGWDVDEAKAFAVFFEKCDRKIRKTCKSDS